MVKRPDETFEEALGKLYDEDEPPSYKELRKRDYPPMGDQLDAIWKALNQMRMDNAINLPQDADDTLGKILSIKKKYPKPSAK